MNKVILLAGPTASGKSDLAIYIAKKINGEIINADSMQVYKEVKILSARPTNYKNIKHHLFGFLTIKKNFSSGEWLKTVEKKINQILKKNKTPIIVGGTGLYFKVLTDGMAQIPNISSLRRKKIINLFNKLGNKKFYNELLKLDPKCKNKIDINDKQRLIRFYEVKYFTKKSIFDWQLQTNSKLSSIRFVKLFLNFSRDYLLERSKKRFHKMIKDGALNEAKRIKNKKISSSLSANNILGLKELIEFIDRKISLEEAIERSLIRTRQYIKRQMTWYRGQMHDWITFEDLNRVILKKKVLNTIRTS
jgi:tRNA dimethylallyltransferase